MAPHDFLSTFPYSHAHLYMYLFAKRIFASHYVSVLQTTSRETYATREIYE